MPPAHGGGGCTGSINCQHRVNSVMLERNNARERARISKLDNDWETYKKLMNKCSKLQIQDN